MRISRFMLIAVLICFSLLLTGCMKTWSVDFTRVADIDDWYYNDFGTKTLTEDEGLRIFGNGSVGTPFAFSGDFEATLTFMLNTDSENTAWLFLYPGDSNIWDPDNHLFIEFDGIGDVGSEDIHIADVGESTYIDAINLDDTTIPHIQRIGENKLIIRKTGSLMEILINDGLIVDFTLVRCEAQHFYINFGTKLYNSADFVFTSIKVKYSGEKIGNL